MASKRARQTSNKTSPDASANMQSVVEKILSSYKPRGTINESPLDIARHLETQDPADVEALLTALSNMTASGPDLSTFNYQSVPVKSHSFWVLQMMSIGFQGRDGQVKDEYFLGSKPIFQIIVYDETMIYRVCDSPQEPGLPTSAFLLDCIKRAIAAPLPPLKQSILSLLLIALKLSPHVDALRPFLDTLPAPFSWRLETPEEADQVATGVHEKNQRGVVHGMRTAETEKAQGNQAMARKDRAGAVKHYTEAIESLRDAAAQNPTDAEMREITKRLGVCYANRAAAWLLDGADQDAKKALRDAENASAVDENYAKAYYRQAKAHQLLDAPSRAIDVLTTALQKPSLAADKGLNDALVDAYGGFPEDENQLRLFCANVFKNEDGDRRVRGINEFKRRANAHVQEVIGKAASIDTI